MSLQEIIDFHRRAAERARGRALRARWKADKVGLNALAEFHTEAAAFLATLPDGAAA